MEQEQVKGTIAEQLSALNAVKENMRIMNMIVREMKEIPELPSEAPKDISPLEKVEFPVEGGILTYMQGHPYPYRGFPYFEFVDKIDLIKKITRAMFSGLYHELKRKNKLSFLSLIPALWIFRSFVRTGIYVFYRIIERFRMKSSRYSQAIRELHRAFSLEAPNEIEDQRELRIRIRDLVCMILENDNAYRFRFQDIAEHLDKDKIKTNPIHELDSLLKLMSEREITQDIKDTWKLLRLFISLYLRFDKRLRNIIINGLSEINIEKVKLTPEDKHFCEGRKDYVFGFMKK